MTQRDHELRGYLGKKTRHGRWRRRWFETSGCHLAYFKAEGGQLLAALNLPEVGEIACVGRAAAGGVPGLFTIELNERVYSVRAEDDDAAQLWVSELKLRQAGGAAGERQGQATAARARAAAERDSVSLVANAGVAVNAGVAGCTEARVALRPATSMANSPSFGCPRCAVQ